MLLSNDSPMSFLPSPIAVILLTLSIASLVWALWRKAKSGRNASVLAVPEEFKH